MYKLFVKGYAPNDDRKYVEKFGKMVKKSKRKSMMKPKSDADKSAHKKLKRNNHHLSVVFLTKTISITQFTS